MAEDGGIEAFCGSEFWNLNDTWYTYNPQFTLCFEETVLVWIPCIYLWLFSFVKIYCLRSSTNSLIPWTLLNVLKLIISGCLLVLQLIDLFYQVHRNSSNPQDVYPNDFFHPVLLFMSILLQTVFVYLDKKNGIQSSGYIFIFWFILAICGLFQYRKFFVLYADDEVETLLFVTYNIYYPLVIIMVLLNCFADARPKNLSYQRGPKACPEPDGSFPNRITFAWLDSLIWTGFRRPLVQDDMWDLTEENASRTVVSNWDKNWEKSAAKAYKKGESQTRATFKSDTEQVTVTGSAGNNNFYVSVLPTMLRTYGPMFLVGSALKFVYDCLQFVSPQILKLLIDFTDSPNEEPWKGYFYAVLLFVVAQIQSFFLGQYFMRMYLVGLRIRTGIISAVYRKALRISSAARKDRSVGEIVNLMSVDAQRFMDLTTYLNMLWSAPLQISLALYFLWNILGPSVLAGLAVLLILIPVNGFIANQVKKLQIKQMKYKDKRVKMMNEILNGMKVLKLYAWEPSFEKQVLDIRAQEVRVLKKAAYLNAITSFIFTCTPFLVTFSTFTTYVLVDPEHRLTSDKIFVSISLMNIMRMPLNIMPMLIIAAVQASVSLKRLNKFLNADELDLNAVEHIPNKDIAIDIQNGTFAWGHDKEDKDILSNINLKVKAGSLIAVVGTVGSGKSSICSALLGDMEKRTGTVNIQGKIAYVAQQAWIQNATVRDNILFGAELNEAVYQQTIDACALKSDLEILPAGDATEIGEKGINLSGGQKQRVSLARAVYTDYDVYILDDPLSAVDSHVGKHIFDNVIGPDSMLKKKTRVLVTHGLTYLPVVDHIIVMKDGRISEQGSYQQLLDNKGDFQEFLLQYLAEEEEEDVGELSQIKSQLEKKLGKEVLERQLSKHRGDSECHDDTKDNASNVSNGSLRRRTKRVSESKHLESPLKTADGAAPKPAAPVVGQKLIETEKSETGKVSWHVYGYYMKAVGWLLTVLTIIFYIASQSCSVMSSIWLSIWSDDANSTDTATRNKYLYVYGSLGFGQAIFILFGAFVQALGCLTASYKLHANLLFDVLHLPMKFFDTNPVGRLINRFSKDIDGMDNTLPWNLRSWLMCFLTVLATFFVIIYSTPPFVLVMIPAMIIYYLVQMIYVATSRQLKRIESVSRSPIYSHFGESIQGSSTIRAYSKVNDFILESEKKVDHNQISSFPSVMANRWLAIRLEFVGNIMIFGAAVFAVVARDSDTGIDSGVVGLSLSYALSVTQTLNWLVRMTSDVETNIVSVERVKEYSETPQEAPWEIPNKKPQKDWPEEGVVKFSKFATRYREGLDLVVKDLDFTINAGEKVGIVGRTGAGKSSLTMALFRIIEAAAGHIIIDGIDIATIGLHDLRSRLTIIPQDPVLFSGTLRMNLDPFECHSDDAVWASLEQAHLMSFVDTLSHGLQHEISEGGDNLSLGQRQLLCLARALLRKTRVLVLDEATAAVDLETDDLIQKTIREQFSSCTVITIAHRLNTIMDNNRVMVLDKGEIKEFGSPQELLASKGLFYGMAKDAGLA